MTIFKKNVLATLIVLAGLGTAVGAYAQNTSDTSSRGTMFESIDTNNDNALSLDEYMETMPKYAENRFNRMDMNSDGIISLDEFNQCKKGKGKRKSKS